MSAPSKTARRRPIHGHWHFAPAPDAAQQAAATALNKALGISEFAARILVRRGMNSAESVTDFQSRRMDLMHDPATLPDMAKAVARIAEAVEKKQKIMLFGDYDVDGITATALMTRFLRVVKRRNPGVEFESRVPERKHGYGLSPTAVAQIKAAQPDLLITLDNGIGSHDAVNALNAAGIDSIIVDHHHVGATLPAAVAVINPKRHDAANTYPFDELCGAGLAFKLAWSLAVHFSHDKKVTPEFRSFLLDALALAATGTLADVVPLVGENRVLAHHGLQALARTQCPGLRALRENSQITGIPIAHDVTFRIAPRINAAGRCAQANDALELLLTDDKERAVALAAQLEQHNTERQSIELRILEDARRQAQATLTDLPDTRALVLHSSDWHIGVIGIVASRIVEEFHRPALLMAINKESGVAQGSGRSVRKLHLHEALTSSREHLLTFGGHAAAAGFTLNSQHIDEFRASFHGAVSSVLTQDDLRPRLHVDEMIPLAQANLKLCRELELFEPCGAGNPRPMLAACGVTISGTPKLMGKEERHLQFFAKQENAARRVVAFNCAEHFNTICDLLPGGMLDLAFRPHLNEYRGETSVELMLESFRVAGDGPRQL